MNQPEEEEEEEEEEWQMGFFDCSSSLLVSLSNSLLSTPLF